jgi:hypothetical protein
MASKLVGLFKTLEWSDFGTPRKSADPAPGARATAANTDADFSFTAGPSPLPVLDAPGKFTLNDNLEITINFKKATSFVNDWVFRRPNAFQDTVLKHEQRHYDVAALIARDLFIDLMQLKAQTFDSTMALQTAINAIQGKYKGKIKSINSLYDGETENGGKSAEQTKWDGFFDEAFTKERVPRIVAPDGKAYKTPLLDVLNAAGIRP